jgi:hypothetical protein
MTAARPAAGPTLAIFELFPGSANAAFSCLLLLRVLDPTDELVARHGVMSFQAWSVPGLASSALRRSSGSLCTTPPGARWLLTRSCYRVSGRRIDDLMSKGRVEGARTAHRPEAGHTSTDLTSASLVCDLAEREGVSGASGHGRTVSMGGLHAEAQPG